MTPVEVAQEYVQKSRKVGKTHAMIMALPDEKCAVMTMSEEHSKHVKDLIKKQRPEYNMDNLTVVVYNRRSGWRDKVQGKDMPVYIDHSVLDAMSVDHVKAINTTYGRI
jgi:hypothetical protein